LSGWAKFWAVDFHVHTPGSADAKPENYGTPDELVKAAMDAGLDAIVVTDHNTTSWVDRVRIAAKATPLVVLPGVEISTSEGHLLALWDEATPVEAINDVLVTLGIRSVDHGKLHIAADFGFAKAAEEVAKAGGLAIAAHVDKPKGLLGLSVKAQLRKALLTEELSAVELVHMDRLKDVKGPIGDARVLAVVQGSDTWAATKSAHAQSGIGARRTWIKAARPDLAGIRHALNDPDLRVVLTEPGPVVYPVIDRVEVSGGFLSGQAIDLCPDLNCLLGGTGAGKSLVLEAIRFCLDQQVDRTAFGHIADEVESRLTSSLGSAGVVTVLLTIAGERYRITRAFGHPPSPPEMSQWAGDDWATVAVHPAELVRLAAFSQGEILEYSREPVGRMSLIDAGLDLVALETTVAESKEAIKDNGHKLLSARSKVQALEAKAARETSLAEKVRELSGLFDTELVKQQDAWKKEAARLNKAVDGTRKLEAPELEVPSLAGVEWLAENDDVFKKAHAELVKLRETVDTSLATIAASIQATQVVLDALQLEWAGRHSSLKRKLDAELNKLSEGSTLPLLREQLERLQGELDEATSAKRDLEETARPELASLGEKREELLKTLRGARHQRRDMRRTRVAELNAKIAGAVKLDIPNDGDFAEFRAKLDLLKVGSHVREDVLESIARTIHPFRFVRLIWTNDIASLASAEDGIDVGSLAKFLANIDNKDLWETLLETQVIERPDTLTVKFRKEDGVSYASVEQLAHGQRCTAILVILLADGSSPVLVDQPEDALHAPWIEEYLVERLRDLRGTRQYLFATRSPGLVVSADAEQILTMKATAGRGELEASGSLERYDLNKLVLHHLEGGPVPFSRRARKLESSTKTDGQL